MTSLDGAFGYDSSSDYNVESSPLALIFNKITLNYKAKTTKEIKTRINFKSHSAASSVDCLEASCTRLPLRQVEQFQPLSVIFSFPYCLRASHTRIFG